MCWSKNAVVCSQINLITHLVSFIQVLNVLCMLTREHALSSAVLHVDSAVSIGLMPICCLRCQKYFSFVLAFKVDMLYMIEDMSVKIMYFKIHYFACIFRPLLLYTNITSLLVYYY